MLQPVCRETLQKCSGVNILDVIFLTAEEGLSQADGVTLFAR